MWFSWDKIDIIFVSTVNNCQRGWTGWRSDLMHRKLQPLSITGNYSNSRYFRRSRVSSIRWIYIIFWFILCEYIKGQIRRLDDWTSWVLARDALPTLGQSLTLALAICPATWWSLRGLRFDITWVRGFLARLDVVRRSWVRLWYGLIEVHFSARP